MWPRTIEVQACPAPDDRDILADPEDGCRIEELRLATADHLAN
ncbi:hypothetical protein ACVDG3_16770 [Meridianimarinicoccus sp. RP-17]|nr:hypothetical protein [Phycocomes zhengii]